MADGTHPAYDPKDPKTSWALNPWVPMSKPIDLKHVGKLIEELGECVSATARCLIQGIAESEPITGKLNREWLEDELADVAANIALVGTHFGLDEERVIARAMRKMEHLRGWHSMLARPDHDGLIADLTEASKRDGSYRGNLGELFARAALAFRREAV